MGKFFEKYALLLLLIFASFLRFYGIDRMDFWYDEAFTGVALKAELPEMMHLISNDVHPPLYYLLAKLFAMPFDYSVLGIRLFGALFGIAGIAAIYLFTKELFDKKAGLLAAFLMSISPFAIQYSQEARMYTMVSFFIVFASYLFLKGLKTERRRYYVLWGVFLGFAYLTHYLAILFVPVFYGMYLWQKKRVLSKNIIIGYFVSFLIFLPWLFFFLHQLKRGYLPWILPAQFSDIFLNIQIFLFGIPKGHYYGMPAPNALSYIDQSSIFTFVTVFLTFIITHLFIKNKQKIIPVLLFSFGSLLIFYLLSLMGIHFFVARYLMPAAYFLFALIGFWLSTLTRKLSLSLLAFYVFLLFAITPVDYGEGYNSFIRDLHKYQNNHFYVLNSFDYVIAKYYLGDDRLILYNRDDPDYDFSAWAAIGKTAKRVSNEEDLKKDRTALILYNAQDYLQQRQGIPFDVSVFSFVAQYDNLLIMRR